MSYPLCYTVRMKIKKEEMKKELIKPIFDLDGTLIKEVRGSKRLFDFENPEAILNLEASDLTPLGILVRDSGKQFDILTARGKHSAPFIRVALAKLGFDVRKIVCVGVDIIEPSDWARVSSKRVVERKQRVVKFIMRKLVDNDARNLEGLGELGELVTEEQTQF